MIALLTACLFFCNPCTRAEFHQQKCARKLCSATLSYIWSTLDAAHQNPIPLLINYFMQELNIFSSEVVSYLDVN